MQLGRGVKWRAFDDGVVVYVPATCETHLLAPELAQIIGCRTPGSSGSAGGAGQPAVDFSSAGASEGAARFIPELVALKILDAGH